MKELIEKKMQRRREEEEEKLRNIRNEANAWKIINETRGKKKWIIRCK